jgi:hypothetical protein
MLKFRFADIADDVTLVIIVTLQLLGKHYRSLPSFEAFAMHKLLAP